MRDCKLPSSGELIAQSTDQFTTKFLKIGNSNQKLVNFQFELCVTACQGSYKNKSAKFIKFYAFSNLSNGQNFDSVVFLQKESHTVGLS